MTQEIAKEFAEEIYFISFHPTGLFVLAGCVDKIRIFTILMDDIRELRDFSVRSCRECVYSNGAQLFVCGNGNIIQVYSTTTFDNVCNMKGHGKSGNYVHLGNQGKHPNIVNLVGACTKQLHKGSIFVIVEFCPMGSLDKFLRTHRKNFINQVDDDLIDLSTSSE